MIIDGDVINSLRVLTYRENRGGEVVAPAFTDQFNGVGLNGSGQLQARIDGISGATLSEAQKQDLLAENESKAAKLRDLLLCPGTSIQTCRTTSPAASWTVTCAVTGSPSTS